MSRIKHLLWHWMANYEVFLPLFSFYAWVLNKNLSTTKRTTELVVDGFPRCGNTYLFALFVDILGFKEVSHHVHGISQIRKGVKLNKPIILFIRNPIDVVISLVLRNPNISLKMAFKHYLLYHQSLAKYLAYEKITFWNFERINDINYLIESTPFLKDNGVGSVSDLDKDKIKERVAFYDMDDQKSDTINEMTVSLPTEARKKRKKELKDEIQNNESYKKLLYQSRQVYTEIFNSSSTVK